MTNVVTLDQVRRHLRIPAANTQDDASLQTFIDGADEVMRRECGENVPTQYQESHDGGDRVIYLYHKPVISIEFVQEGWGFTNYTLDFVQVNSPPGSVSMFAYSLDVAETGEVSRRTAGNINIPFHAGVSNIDVVYTAGRNPIPPVIQLAELELISHWWMGSQQRSSGQMGQYGYDTTSEDFVRSGPTAGLMTVTYGVPMRILEMIKQYRSEPIIG